MIGLEATVEYIKDEFYFTPPYEIEDVERELWKTLRDVGVDKEIRAEYNSLLDKDKYDKTMDQSITDSFINYLDDNIFIGKYSFITTETINEDTMVFIFDDKLMDKIARSKGLEDISCQKTKYFDTLTAIIKENAEEDLWDIWYENPSAYSILDCLLDEIEIEIVNKDVRNKLLQCFSIRWEEFVETKSLMREDASLDAYFHHETDELYFHDNDDIEEEVEFYDDGTVKLRIVKIIT